MDDWKTYKLSEISEIVGGGTPSTAHEDYWNGTIPWLTPRDLTNYDRRYISRGERSITEKGLRNSSSRLLPTNTVLMSSRAPIGYLAIADTEICTNQGFKSFVLDEDEVDYEFFYYLLKNNVDYLKSLGTGTTFAEVSAGRLKGIEFQFPGIVEQKAIAKILSSLDDKIELNRRMNATLEAMARALFKAWFVDFEPVHANKQNRPSTSASPEIAKLFPSHFENNIPKGWRNTKLEDLVDTVSITHKLPNDEIIFLNTSDISEGHVLTHKYSQVEGLPGQAKKSIQKHDILYSEIRPGNRRYAYIGFDSEDYVVSTKLMVLRTKNSVDPVLLFYFLKSDEIVGHLQMLAETRSGTFPQITFDQLRRLEMLLPNDEVLKHYSDFLNVIFNKSNHNVRENQQLAEIRDSLLPRLISGELRVGTKA